jgi:hypothetical protein
VSSAYKITGMVEFVLGFFPNQYSPRFVGAEQLRRAMIWGM